MPNTYIIVGTDGNAGLSADIVHHRRQTRPDDHDTAAVHWISSFARYEFAEARCCPEPSRTVTTVSR